MESFKKILKCDAGYIKAEWQWLQCQRIECASGTDLWEDITMFKIVFAALLTLSALTVTAAAITCPDGYVPCGETSQLCCPI